MADTYKIIIQNGTGEQTDVNTTNIETPAGQVLEVKEESGTTPPKPKDKEKNIKDTLTYAAGAYVGKQAFSFVASNITEWTGNRNASKVIEAGTKAIGYATALAINPVLGVLNIGFDIGSSVYNLQRQNFYADLNARQLQERSGREIFSKSGRNINYRR